MENNNNLAKIIPLPKRKVRKPRKKRSKTKKFLAHLYKKIDGYEIITIIIGVVAAEITYDLIKMALIAIL